MIHSIFKIKNSGYALIETLFYIALLAIFSIAIVNSIIIMTKSFKETTLQAELMQGGTIIERISREVRQANSIATISSTSLKVNTVDGDGNPKTVEFLLSGTDIQFLENGALTGNLNTGNVIIGGLSFEQILTTNGVAVKMTLTLSSSHDKLLRESDFYDTVVLRGSYE